MSEMTIFFKAVKAALKSCPPQDPSILVNRDGSVRINLNSPEGRARVLQAAKSIQHINLTGNPKAQ